MTTPILRLGALLLAVVLAAPLPAAAQDTIRIGTVVQQRGSVTVMRGNRPALLRLGSSVFQGDRVVTGPQSRIRIELSDRSVLAIGAETDMVLIEQTEDRSGNPLRNVVSLLYGIVRATVVIVGPQHSFDIETQTAIASARSTDWLVEGASDRSSVFVVTGAVSVAGRGGGSVLLTAGLGTDVIGSAPPSAPAAWGSSRRDAALARTNVP